MPKSKRNKQVELSKTKKHGLEGKKHLYEEIRKSVDTFTNIFVFSVNDMRNSKMKTVREQWKHSRFFIGKNKVMALALGRCEEESYRDNLHKIGEQLKGEKGLLFTNQSLDEVLKWFRSYSETDFARSGNTATEDVLLSEGPLPQFPHSLESYLRQLGMPTTLKRGVIHLVKDHLVCNAGDVLSPETARVLKLLGYEMAEFHIKLEYMWSQDGTFRDLKSGHVELGSKENISWTTPSKVSEFEKVDGGEEAMDVTGVDESYVIGSAVYEVASSKPASEDKEAEDSKVPSEAKTKDILFKKTKDDIASETEDIVQTDSEVDEEKEMEDNELEGYANNHNLVEGVTAETNQKKSKASKRNKNGKSTNANADVLESESQEEIPDIKAIHALTEKKLSESAARPKKYSPKMTRARAAATNTKLKTPEPLETITRSARKAPRKKVE